MSVSNKITWENREHPEKLGLVPYYPTVSYVVDTLDKSENFPLSAGLLTPLEATLCFVLSHDGICCLEWLITDFRLAFYNFRWALYWRRQVNYASALSLLNITFGNLLFSTSPWIDDNDTYDGIRGAWQKKRSEGGCRVKGLRIDDCLLAIEDWLMRKKGIKWNKGWQESTAELILLSLW